MRFFTIFLLISLSCPSITAEYLKIGVDTKNQDCTIYIWKDSQGRERVEIGYSHTSFILSPAREKTASKRKESHIHQKAQNPQGGCEELTLYRDSQNHPLRYAYRNNRLFSYFFPQKKICLLDID